VAEDNDELYIGTEGKSVQGQTGGKGDAAAWLAKMERENVMAKKIKGEHEIQRFMNDIPPLIDGHGSRDWGSMAMKWNEFVAEREKLGNNTVIKFYRKQPHMLESFFGSSEKSLNIKATVQQYQLAIDSLTTIHRTPVDNPVTDKSAPRPAPSHGPDSIIAENRDFSNMTSVLPLQMIHVSALTSQSSGPLIIPGQVNQVNKKDLKRIRERAPQICCTCGHYRSHNKKHDINHNGTCTVSKEMHSTDRSLSGWCDCLECATGAASVGHCKPVIVEKEKRSWKTCGTCGHYKDHGSHKDRCNIPNADEGSRILYVGWCVCEICLTLADLNDYTKPVKLRKIYGSKTK
jgi:hypothetical protein